jgi:hypothetical protein
MSIIESKNEENDEAINGLEKAISTAWAKLAQQKPDDIISRTQCILGESSSSFVVPFIGDEFQIDIENKNVTDSNGKEFFNLFKIGIILHYMTHAKDMSLKSKLISFRELWGGNEYYYAFNNRVLKPLIQNFSEKPEQLLQAGQSLGGHEIKEGEVGLTIPALPRVPVTVLLWTGDDEVAASANVLFDATANEQMETEALVWLAVAVVSDLNK